METEDKPLDCVSEGITGTGQVIERTEQVRPEGLLYYNGRPPTDLLPSVVVVSIP